MKINFIPQLSRQFSCFLSRFHLSSRSLSFYSFSFLILVFSMVSLAPCFFSSLHAIKPKSKNFRSEEEANRYLVKHYNRGCKYFNADDWRWASSQFERVIFYFPNSDTAVEASYYLAVCYYKMREYDFANEEFSNYLKGSEHPTYFVDAVMFKFCIAERFKRGRKKHPLKFRYLPRVVSGEEYALIIYDEIIAALPNHELAVRALYSKGELLKEMRQYRESVEAFQTIIRRFPKDEVVPACYINIADAYIKQAEIEFQNPDILALAELNVRKFKADFPRDERNAIVEGSIGSIKEMYAKGLCDLGLFYERMHHPEAAAIYFQSAIEEFPDTRVSQFCRFRLKTLGYFKPVEASSCEQLSPSCEEPLIEASSPSLELLDEEHSPISLRGVFERNSPHSSLG